MADILREADILGAWRLLCWRIDYSDGRAPTHPFGTNATGLLVYAPGGFMSAGIARAGRAGLGGGSVRAAPAAARAAAFDGYFHYQGRFVIAGSTIEHHVAEALNPDFAGSVQVRHATLAGNTLVLAAEDALPGSAVRRFHRLEWERAG